MFWPVVNAVYVSVDPLDTSAFGVRALPLDNGSLLYASAGLLYSEVRVFDCRGAYYGDGKVAVEASFIRPDSPSGWHKLTLNNNLLTLDGVWEYYRCSQKFPEDVIPLSSRAIIEYVGCLNSGQLLLVTRPEYKWSVLDYRVYIGIRGQKMTPLRVSSSQYLPGGGPAQINTCGGILSLPRQSELLRGECVYWKPNSRARVALINHNIYKYNLDDDGHGGITLV